MRADRLLSILLLLQIHRKLTAANLARRLEVSERTIHRDMEALAMAGVPVYAERGGGGGWVLPESFRTEVTGLTDAEVQALFVTNSSRLLADLGLDQASGAAVIKLLASLPAMARRDAERMRQRILVDGAGWHARPDEPVPALVRLQEALWLERIVRFHYRRDDRHAGTEPYERTVDPLGLVAKGRLWYLVAMAGAETRTYRVSRIHDVEILELPSARPEDFDLAAHWAASASGFVERLPQFPITVRVSPEAYPNVWIPGSYARVVRSGEADATGWRTVDLVLQTRDEAIRYLLGFAATMRVLSPPGLRQSVLTAATDLIAAYESHHP